MNEGKKKKKYLFGRVFTHVYLRAGGTNIALKLNNISRERFKDFPCCYQDQLFLVVLKHKLPKQQKKSRVIVNRRAHFIFH